MDKKELLQNRINKVCDNTGWDVAITSNGPEIVEGNNRQGSYLIQYPFAICNREGKRHTIDPYLWF